MTVAEFAQLVEAAMVPSEAPRPTFLNPDGDAFSVLDLTMAEVYLSAIDGGPLTPANAKARSAVAAVLSLKTANPEPAAELEEMARQGSWPVIFSPVGG